MVFKGQLNVYTNTKNTQEATYFDIRVVNMKSRFMRVLTQDHSLGSFLLLRPSSFFFPFTVVRPTQIFGIFKKIKKRSDVATPFFTWNNSFDLKNEHRNNIEKNRNKNMNNFHSILYILLSQICECYLLTSSWGTRAYYSETSWDGHIIWSKPGWESLKIFVKRQFQCWNVCIGCT